MNLITAVKVQVPPPPSSVLTTQTAPRDWQEIHRSPTTFPNVSGTGAKAKVTLYEPPTREKCKGMKKSEETERLS